MPGAPPRNRESGGREGGHGLAGAALGRAVLCASQTCPPGTPTTALQGRRVPSGRREAMTSIGRFRACPVRREAKLAAKPA